MFHVKDHFTFWDSYGGADFAEEKIRLKRSPKDESGTFCFGISPVRFFR